jgi:hypothetical protein
MRRFPVSDGFEKILLFYFPIQDGVDLVRVVHGNRDLEQLLNEGFFGWPVSTVRRASFVDYRTRRHRRGRLERQFVDKSGGQIHWKWSEEMDCPELSTAAVSKSAANLAES